MVLGRVGGGEHGTDGGGKIAVEQRQEFLHEGHGGAKEGDGALQTGPGRVGVLAGSTGEERLRLGPGWGGCRWRHRRGGRRSGCHMHFRDVKCGRAGGLGRGQGRERGVGKTLFHRGLAWLRRIGLRGIELSGIEWNRTGWSRTERSRTEPILGLGRREARGGHGGGGRGSWIEGPSSVKGGNHVTSRGRADGQRRATVIAALFVRRISQRLYALAQIIQTQVMRIVHD